MLKIMAAIVKAKVFVRMKAKQNSVITYVTIKHYPLIITAHKLYGILRTPNCHHQIIVDSTRCRLPEIC